MSWAGTRNGRTIRFVRGAILAFLLVSAGQAAGTSCSPALIPQNVLISFTSSTASCSPQNPYCRFGSPITFTPVAWGDAFSCGPFVFTWNFGDGTTVIVNTPAPVTHSFVSGGQQDVTLKIEGSYTSITLIQTLFIGIYDVWDPPATFTVERVSGLVVALTPFAPAGVTSMTWDFGDGSPWTLNAPVRMTHQYAEPGTYTITLRTVSAHGDLSVYSLDVTAFARQRAARH